MRFASYRKRRISRAWSLLTAAAAAAGLGSAAHAASYPESNYGGDFSNDSAAPTQLGAFAVGGNTVSGTTGDGDNDYFSFEIAAGDQLDSITLLASAVAPDRTFIAIVNGDSAPPISSFMSGGQFVTAAGLLGWSLINDSQDGQDILPALGASAPANFPPFPGATGFTGPLAAGTYTMWVLDGDGPVGTPYSLDYGVSAVPEASTWVMIIAGFGIAGSTLRRSRRLIAAG